MKQLIIKYIVVEVSAVDQICCSKLHLCRTQPQRVEYKESSYRTQRKLQLHFLCLSVCPSIYLLSVYIKRSRPY